MEQIAAIKVSVSAAFIAALALAAATLCGGNKSTLEAPPRAGELQRDVSARMRDNVSGPLQNSARFNDLGQKNAAEVQAIIERADRAAKNIEAVEDELRRTSNDADPSVQEALRNLDEASADAMDLLATTRRELQSRLPDHRAGR